MKDLQKLQAIAKELNTVLGLDPKIKVVGISEEKLIPIVKQAVDLITPDDEVTEETQQFIADLFDPEVDETPEETDESERIDELVDAIVTAQAQSPSQALKALKALVQTEEEFESLRKKVPGKFSVSELAEEMFLLLGHDFEQPEEVATPPAPKATAAPKAPKATEGKSFVKEGSMAEFLDNLVQAGGNWADLLLKANEETAKRGKANVTKGILTSHIKYRLAKDVKFLGAFKITDKGIA